MKQQEKQKEQIAIFDGFGAYVLAKDYIQSGQKFCDAAQVKFFTLEEEIAEELAILHLSKGFALCNEAQKEVFKLSKECAERIVEKELELGLELNDETLPLIAELPQGMMILENYYLATDIEFSPQAQDFLLTLPELAPVAQKFIQINKNVPRRLSDKLQKYAEEHGWIRPIKKAS